MRFEQMTISEFIEKLKELSKKHKFSTTLSLALTQNKILLHLSTLELRMTDIDDHKDLKFDTVKELQDDIDELFTEELHAHEGSSYVTAIIPDAIVEPDPWEDYDNYYDYDLFDRFYNEKSKDSLTIEQKFDDKKSNIEYLTLKIYKGDAKLQSYDEAKIYQFQYNMEIVDTLNKIMENPYQFVSTSELEDDADKLLNDINNIYKKQSEMNLDINKGQIVTHKTLTFNYIEKNYQGQLTGVVYNTFYVYPDYNKFNKMKYNTYNKKVPLYHNIIKNDMNMRTTFGYKYQPALSPFNLRKMNDCDTTYEQTLTKVFDSENFKFDKMEQIYIDITKPATIDKVLVDLSRYYFLSRNELVAEIEVDVDKMRLSYEDLKKEKYKEEITKTVQNFINSATK